MSLKQYLGKKLGGIRLLHETVMAADAAAVLKDNRAANRSHSHRSFQANKKGTPSMNAATADEEMGIHVGDVHNEHHYHGGEAVNTNTITKGSSVLKKAAIGAALIATGAGATAALPLAAGLLNDSPAMQDTDTDNSVEIEIE